MTSALAVPGSIALITPSVTVIRRRLVDPLRGRDARALRASSESLRPFRDDEHHATSACAASRDGRDRQDVVEHRHAHDEAGAHLVGDERLLGVGDARVDLDAAVHRPGMHHDLPGPHARRA